MSEELEFRIPIEGNISSNVKMVGNNPASVPPIAVFATCTCVMAVYTQSINMVQLLGA